MPSRPISRRLVLLRHRICKLLRLHRQADLLYVRLLEGYLNHKKSTLLYDIVRRLEGPGAIAEVGSWKGKSTVTLALAARHSSRTDPVYAIDHHEGSEEHQAVIQSEGSTWPKFQHTIQTAGVASTVEPLKMRSLEGARWLAKNNVRLKFLFLDGAHDEDSVRSDLLAFRPLLLPGAYVALDDARPSGSFPGVYRAYEDVLKPCSEEVAWGGSILCVRLVESSTSAELPE